MRSQTEVRSATVLERMRALGTIEVTRGVSFEADLARQLDLPEFTSAQLVEVVENLVFEGKLRRYDTSTRLKDPGGIAKDPVDDKVTVLTVIASPVITN